MDDIYIFEKKNICIKGIIEIIVYAVIGYILAICISNIVYSGSDNYDLIWIFIPLPYGILKTWNSFLVLTAGGIEMWMIWFIYVVIKIIIAIFYGMFCMPVILVINIVNVIRYKKMLRRNNTINM